MPDSRCCSPVPCPTPSPRRHADSRTATPWPLVGSCASSTVGSPSPTTSPPPLQHTKLFSRRLRVHRGAQCNALAGRSSLFFPLLLCLFYFVIWHLQKHIVMSLYRRLMKREIYACGLICCHYRINVCCMCNFFKLKKENYKVYILFSFYKKTFTGFLSTTTLYDHFAIDTCRPFLFVMSS